MNMKQMSQAVSIVVVAILACGCCLTGGNPPLLPTDPEAQADLHAFYTLRHYIEDIADLANDTFGNDEQQISQARLLYSRAASEANGFIDHMQQLLTARQLSETDLKPAADKVREAAKAFEDYVLQRVPRDDFSALMIVSLGDLVYGVVRSGIAIWAAVKEDERRTIEETRDQLDEVRWKRWSELFSAN